MQTAMEIVNRHTTRYQHQHHHHQQQQQCVAMVMPCHHHHGVRVPHRDGNTRGVWAVGHASMGMVCEFDNCGYTIPITTVLQVLAGIF